MTTWEREIEAWQLKASKIWTKKRIGKENYL